MISDKGFCTAFSLLLHILNMRSQQSFQMCAYPNGFCLPHELYIGFQVQTSIPLLCLLFVNSGTALFCIPHIDTFLHITEPLSASLTLGTAHNKSCYALSSKHFYWGWGWVGGWWYLVCSAKEALELRSPGGICWVPGSYGLIYNWQSGYTVVERCAEHAR